MPLVLIFNPCTDNFHSKVVIRSLMLVSATETVLMLTVKKMPINRPVKTTHSQLQSVKHELIAKNRDMGWVRVILINTDVNVCSHITPQHVGFTFASLAKRKIYSLCGSDNVRAKQEGFWFAQRYLWCLCFESTPRPNAISVNPLKTHVADNIPKETIKPSPGKLRPDK